MTKRKVSVKEKKYFWFGKVFKDGDRFVVQEEAKGENRFNPSGKGIYTFNHKSFNGWKEMK